MAAIIGSLGLSAGVRPLVLGIVGTEGGALPPMVGAGSGQPAGIRVGGAGSRLQPGSRQEARTSDMALPTCLAASDRIITITPRTQGSPPHNPFPHSSPRLTLGSAQSWGGWAGQRSPGGSQARTDSARWWPWRARRSSAGGCWAAPDRVPECPACTAGCRTGCCPVSHGG